MSEMFMDMHGGHRRFSKCDSDDKRSAGFAMTTDTDADTTATTSATVTDEDPLSNILRLQLKKPLTWKWELTTSRSSTNIALPRILLYNHKGDLLADANGREEQIFGDKSAQNKPVTVKRKQQKIQRRAASSCLENAIKQTGLDTEFGGLHIEEALKPTMTSRLVDPIIVPNNRINHQDHAPSCSSFREVRFKVEDPPSTTTSSSGPREKRKYRRANASHFPLVHSNSILERSSAFKCRLSSPDSIAEPDDVYSRPRYFLRTCKAGTLVVAEESFSRSNRKLRRRPRNSTSTECVNADILLNNRSLRRAQNNHTPPDTQQLGNGLRLNTHVLEGQSSPSVQDEFNKQRERRKLFQIRRHRSDANVLLNAFSSEDEVNERKDNCNENGRKRKSPSMRRPSKKGVVAAANSTDLRHTAENHD